MKKLLFIFLAMFSVTILLANNQKVESRPVLFLDSWALYDNRRTNDDKYMVFELQAAHEKNQLIFKEWDVKQACLHSLLKETTDVAKREKIYKDLAAVNEYYSSIQNKEFCEVRDRVCKRITELCEQYAKEMDACMVIDPRTSPFPLYIDPVYDITAKVLDQLNKEYLEKNSSQSAKQPCICQLS